MPKSTRSTARHRTSLQSHHVVLPTRRQTRSGQQSSSSAPAPASTTRRTKKPPSLAFLSRTQHVINADPNRRTCLFTLPRELLVQIASNLPLVSVICLTLTCKEAAEAIGTESWAKYRKEKQWLMDREEFFDLLAKDWGDVLEFCPRCDTLHPPLQPPRSHRETRVTKCCFGQDAMIDYLPQDAIHGYNPVFHHIANAMEESKDSGSKHDVGPLIDTLSGNSTITKNNLSWSLGSSGQRIDGNLIVKHVHMFQSKTNKGLRATDLLSLSVRLCPHQSTTIATPERSRYIKGAELNGLLLTHVINSAFPASARADISLKSFKRLTPSEEAQVSAAQAGKHVYWRCRSCPTKYRVQHSEDRFSITSWHCFGRDILHMSKYWKWLVRRSGTMLGSDKRNDEWWSPSRTVPDFVCETYQSQL